MRFWDTSAVVPLLVRERQSNRRLALIKDDAWMVVWWATHVECVSALTRLHRASGIDDAALERALRRLDVLGKGWVEVEPVNEVRALARRLLRVHPLRAADALQLAAALSVCEQDPGQMPFVCADDRLNEAARREGFQVIT